MFIAGSKIIDTILIAGAGLLLALLTPIAAAAQNSSQNKAAPLVATSSGTCAPTASKFVTATGEIMTTSPTPVNVANTTINFVQGGTKPSCVIVLFSAEAKAAADTFMIVRVLLDTATACQPGELYFVNSNATYTGYAARAMNFVCPNVAPGSHKIKMQYRRLSGGGVYLDFRTTILQYVKPGT